MSVRRRRLVAVGAVIGSRGIERARHTWAIEVDERRAVKLAGMLAAVRPGLVVNEDAVADIAVRPSQGEWARFLDACD
jgi:hypothetical protein